MKETQLIKHSSFLDHLIGLILSTLCFFIFKAFFPELYLDGGKVLSDLGFDGFKNYFTFGYTVKYPNGFWFDGMMFPYGDALIFADAQPAFSVPLGWLNKTWPWIGDHTALIINYLMGLGLSLGGYIIYLNFREVGVPFLLAFLFALGVVFLSPQIWRITLHHGLSYLFVIPFFMRLLLRGENRSFLSVALYGLLVLFILFIHSYYALILALWIGGDILARLVLRKKLFHHSQLSLWVPLVVYYIFILSLFTGDRPESPWGILVFAGSISDIIVPFTGLIAESLSGWMGERSYVEGSAYIGWVATIGIGCYIFFTARRHDMAKNVKLEWLHYLFIASIPSLFMGMMWPLCYLGEEGISYIPIVRQFRGCGRFLWTVYYCWTLVGLSMLVVVGHQFVAKQMRWLAYAILVSVLLFESYQNIKGIAKQNEMYSSPDFFTEKRSVLEALEQNEIGIDDLVAVIELPQSTIGSEKFQLYNDFAAKMAAWPLAMQTGLPMTSINLSRSRLDHVTNVMAFLSDQNSALVEDFPEGKYVVVCPKSYEKLYPNIILSSDKIGSHENLNYYIFNFEKDKSRDFSAEEKEVLFSEEATLELKGSDAWRGSRRYDIPVEAWPEDTVHLSIWNRVSTSKGGILKVFLYQKDHTGSIIEENSMRESLQTRFEVKPDGWVNYIHKVGVSDACHELMVEIKGGGLELGDFSIFTNRAQQEKEEE